MAKIDMILAEDWFFKKLFSAKKVQAAQLKKRKKIYGICGKLLPIQFQT